jgi:hypothetical protein
MSLGLGQDDRRRLVPGSQEAYNEHGRMLQEQVVPTQRSLHQAGLNGPARYAVRSVPVCSIPILPRVLREWRLLVGFGTNPNNSNGK